MPNKPIEGTAIKRRYALLRSAYAAPHRRRWASKNPVDPASELIEAKCSGSCHRAVRQGDAS